MTTVITASAWMRIVHTIAPAPTAKGLRIAIRGACNGLSPASRPAPGDDQNSVLVQYDVLLDRLSLDVQCVGWEVRVWIGDRQADYESRVPTGCSIQWSLRRSRSRLDLGSAFLFPDGVAGRMKRSLVRQVTRGHKVPDPGTSCACVIAISWLQPLTAR